VPFPISRWREFVAQQSQRRFLTGPSALFGMTGVVGGEWLFYAVLKRRSSTVVLAARGVSQFKVKGTIDIKVKGRQECPPYTS
jgi:hypothetical protein